MERKKKQEKTKLKQGSRTRGYTMNEKKGRIKDKCDYV
jgi:hypothetical protein